MSSAPYDSKTLGYYAQTAEAYLATRPEASSRHLTSFLGLLNPGASILELGCGGGRDVQAMINAGFVVDATDGVAEMAAQATQRLGQKVRVMRFDELAAVAAFDAIWANSSLLHVPRVLLPDVVRRIFTALKPGGFHFANFKAGDNEGRDERERYYNYLLRDEMVAIYAGAADWEIVSAVDYLGGARFETQQVPWVAITVRKKA